MLCLLTLADIEAVSPETLTPWKEELIWRLYVDTYNHLTQRYGDELIERNQAGLIELLAGRPEDLPEAEITRFVEGLPQRYLQLFPREAIYRHVRLARDIGPDEVHLSLERADSVWTLAVVTLDKPFLFSNICGVLSSFGMNILRGHALTNPNGLVLDVFQFTDDERFLELNPDAGAQVLHVLQEVVVRPRGRHRAAARPRAERAAVAGTRGSRRSSAPTTRRPERYTILDIVAGNALGLLYRISRVISQHGCDVDLVLISTEGERAIDVFHITKAGAKLTEAEQRALTSDLQGTLEGTYEADQEHRPPEQGGRRQGRAGQAEHLRHDGDRGARPRQAEGPHRHLPRQGIQRQPAAEDGNRSRRAGLDRRRRDQGDRRGGADRRDRRRPRVRAAGARELPHPDRREGEL